MRNVPFAYKAMITSQLIIPQAIMFKLKERGINVDKAVPSPDVEGVWHMYVNDDEKVKILHALADLGVAKINVQV